MAERVVALALRRPDGVTFHSTYAQSHDDLLESVRLGKDELTAEHPVDTWERGHVTTRYRFIPSTQEP